MARKALVLLLLHLLTQDVLGTRSQLGQESHVPGQRSEKQAGVRPGGMGGPGQGWERH